MTGLFIDLAMAAACLPYWTYSILFLIIWRLTGGPSARLHAHTSKRQIKGVMIEKLGMGSS